MTTKLLIVESPAKCQKIQGFLGAGWRVQATMGHIRALKEELEALGFPKGGRGDPHWAPTYETILAKASAIANLRKAAAGAEVYLGADDDREGEAIAWHTCAILGLDPATTPRVVFHEITAPALRSAVAAPRTIDFNKFNAQQARSMLDMLIGFTLSPCLWRGVGNKPGLSAGRCQTPALRIIYDRDRAIETFEPTVTWRITTQTDNGLTWKATSDVDGDAAAATILKALVGPAKTQTLTVTDRTERVATSQPPKPFITSSLQQEASSRLGMNPKVTMKAAQTLYEGGHITYMRTDNAILSAEASEAAAAVVRERWGEEYLGGVSAPEGEEAAAPKKKVVKKAKVKAEAEKPEAQAAHEGIRPTHMEVPTLDDVGANERRLYDLIWKRTIQSVMAAEERDVVKLTAVPTAAPTLLTLATDWDKTRFAGWRMLDAEKKTEDEAAAETTFAARVGLVKGTLVPWSSFAATETRSSAPSRYTEAALIRELEGRSIGRPSTYATLVETVLERGYVEKATIVATPTTVRGLELKAGAKSPKETSKTEKTGGEKDKLRTTALGRTVIEWLLAEFGDMIEYDFTAQMESQLDDVAKGAHVWSDVLESTWTRYKDRYRAIMDTARATTADGSGGPKKTTGNTANRAEFGDGYKMIVSRKGPLFVLEREGETTRFASVPAHLSLQTATREDVEKAFTASGGGSDKTQSGGSGLGHGSNSDEAIGELDGKPVTVRNGKFGYYATWDTVRINCKQTDTMAELEPRLKAKAAPDAVSHDVGTFCIRRGPYGLYMFKKAVGSTKKPTFVSIPESTDYKALTLEGAEQLYKHSLDTKSKSSGSTFKPKAKKAAAEEE
jgi:DNA topoisomerase-1